MGVVLGAGRHRYRAAKGDERRHAGSAAPPLLNRCHVLPPGLGRERTRICRGSVFTRYGAGRSKISR